MDGKYEFYLTVTDRASISTITSNTYTLHVGCTDATVPIFNLAAEVLQPPTYAIGSPSTQGFWKFTYIDYDFTAGRKGTWCNLTSVEMVPDNYTEVENDGKLPPVLSWKQALDCLPGDCGSLNIDGFTHLFN